MILERFVSKNEMDDTAIIISNHDTEYSRTVGDPLPYHLAPSSGQNLASAFIYGQMFFV